MTVIHLISSSFLVILLGSYISCARISPPRWTNPCGGGRSNGRPVAPTPPSANRPTDSPGETNVIIADIVGMCETARQRARNLKMRVLTERLTLAEDDEFVQDKLNTHQLEGFPEIAVSEEETVGDTFFRDYERLSRAAVFLEQLAFEERKYQFGEYIQDISRVEEAVYTTLCYLESGIHGQGLIIESYVTRDVMIDTDKNISHKPSRDMRDYVILKDVEALKGNVKAEYETLNVSK